MSIKKIYVCVVKKSTFKCLGLFNESAEERFRPEREGKKSSHDLITCIKLFFPSQLLLAH